MHLPNPYLTRAHLKTLVTPDQYQDFLRRYVYKWVADFDISVAGEDFWQSLPEYRLAQCPFCGQEYGETLNTYGLHGWMTGSHERVYMKREARNRRCPHFAAVTTYINFNNFVPNEVSDIDVELDVPCVTPAYLNTAFAVLHSLPICRIERGQFVPRYLLYTLTYYSEDGKFDLSKRLAALPPRTGEDDGEYFPEYFDTFGAGLDLERWAKQGKVLWLDPATLELRRWQGGQHKFPYAKIHGYETTVKFYRGQIKFPYDPPKT